MFKDVRKHGLEDAGISSFHKKIDDVHDHCLFGLGSQYGIARYQRPSSFSKQLPERPELSFPLSFSVTQPNTHAYAHATDNPNDRRKREGWACDPSCSNKTKPKSMAFFANL